MGIIQIIIIFIFNFTLILNQNIDDSCSDSEQSPVNIITSEIREISVPPLKIIRSYYPSFGNIKLDLNDMSLKPDKWENAKLYIDYYNKTVIYIPDKIYVRIFSEHSFENLKYDIELQICHNYANIENQNDIDVPEKLCISIFFDSGRNKKSKIFDQFYKEREYEDDLTKKYILKNIENIDLNLYINFNEPYYFYMGSGTSVDNKEFDCSLQVYWILMKKVNYMSEEELRNLRLAIIQKNKKKTIKKSKKVKNEGNLIYYFENKKEKSD